MRTKANIKAGFHNIFLDIQTQSEGTYDSMDFGFLPKEKRPLTPDGKAIDYISGSGVYPDGNITMFVPELNDFVEYSIDDDKLQLYFDNLLSVTKKVYNSKEYKDWCIGVY